MTTKAKLFIVPIRQGTPISKCDELVADVAYTLWLSSAFSDGLPEEALFTALRLVKGKSFVRLFVVPERRRTGGPIMAMERRLCGG